MKKKVKILHIVPAFTYGIASYSYLIGSKEIVILDMCWMPDARRGWSTDSSRTAQRPRCAGQSQTAR